MFSLHRFALLLPAFLGSLGVGPEKLGVIEGIAESVASFTKLFSGYLADRLPRRKPLVVGGYLLANAVKPVLALATSWWQVLLIRFSDRLAKGVRGAPRDVMLAEIPLILRRGQLYASAAIVGAALYLILERAGMPRDPAALTGMATIVLVRFAAILWRLELPVLTVEDQDHDAAEPK